MTTKFDIGQKVYSIIGSKIELKEVESIRIEKGCTYYTVMSGIRNEVNRWVKAEHELFTSKEELINSL